MTKTIFSATIALALTSAATAAEKSATDEAGIRAAVERALPYVEKYGRKWRDNRKCVSCHRVSFTIWAGNAADAAGFKVDRKRQAEWVTWSVDWKHRSQNGKDKSEAQAANKNPDTIGQLILAWDSARSESDKVPEWATRFRDHLLRTQRKDGSWKPGGQLPLQRRAFRETTDVTVMWTALALTTRGLTSDKTKSVVDRAWKYLATGKPGVGTEWWAAKLLLADRLDKTDEADRTRKKLIALQHKDGGWGWMAADKSDAFGTGLALYALARTGGETISLARGRAFLLKTQRANGSWLVPGTRKKDQKRPKETSNYWGTTWAVIGLAETLKGTTSK